VWLLIRIEVVKNVHVIELGQRPQLVVAILQNNAAFIVDMLEEKTEGCFPAFARFQTRERTSQRKTVICRLCSGREMLISDMEKTAAQANSKLHSNPFFHSRRRK
jgi:hypothetical protein